MTVFYVTHNYLLTHRMFEQKREGVTFLKAYVSNDGARTYEIREGEPERSAHARELYQSMLADSDRQNIETLG